MMNNVTPERAGIRSADIRSYVQFLESHHYAMHSILIARGDDIIFEHYVKPFHADFCHRLYSVTKSFTSLAIGFCIQDGLVRLDSTMKELFPEETAGITDRNVLNQTVRDMLMMKTSKSNFSWFTSGCDDRVKQYFDPRFNKNYRPPQSFWEYDSPGSFVLGALVERLTGKRLIEYLREKCLDKIGFSKEARCLKCPGGHSWADSAFIAKPRDLMYMARFVLNGGSWNGEQLLDPDYIRDATDNLTANSRDVSPDYDKQGYGYQFWRTNGNCYACFGMGGQIAVMCPEKDMILVTTADTQGDGPSMGHIVDGFVNLVVKNAGEPLPESSNHGELLTYCAGLRLSEAIGDPFSLTEAKIDGVEYSLAENPMGITRFKFTFNSDGGVFEYTNAQGDKTLDFGRVGYGNKYGLFPEEGYSKEIGSVSEPGHRYKCAASAAWAAQSTLSLRVQVIDDYFGNMTATFVFDGDNVKLEMKKTAEDFLKEYTGSAVGHKA